MGGRDDRGNGEIEWLDGPSAADGPDVIASPPRRPRVPSLDWRVGFALAAVAVIAGAVALVAPHQSKSAAKAAAAKPSASAAAAGSISPPAPASIAPTPAPSTPTTSAPPTAVITTDNGAPFLAGAPANLEVFAVAPGVVLRLQLARGLVTSTAIPDLASTGPVAFLAGSNAAIVRPLDNVTGYLIPDNGPVSPLAGLLANGGAAFPGPDPAHVWIETESGATSAMQLVTLDGQAAGASVTIPDTAGSPSSDGAGDLLFASIDGIFAARPGSLRRVTTGQLLAVGPTRWLTEECDAHLRCGLVVINRTTGASRQLNTPPSPYAIFGGQISPDGRTAALLGISAGSDQERLHLLDLSTGADTVTPIGVDQSEDMQDGGFAWSPDSRWLFAIDNGAVSAIDRATDERQVIITGSAQLSQLAVRVDP